MSFYKYISFRKKLKQNSTCYIQESNIRNREVGLALLHLVYPDWTCFMLTNRTTMLSNNQVIIYSGHTLIVQCFTSPLNINTYSQLIKEGLFVHGRLTEYGWYSGLWKKWLTMRGRSNIMSINSSYSTTYCSFSIYIQGTSWRNIVSV